MQSYFQNVPEHFVLVLIHAVGGQSRMLTAHCCGETFYMLGFQHNAVLISLVNIQTSPSFLFQMELDHRL